MSPISVHYSRPLAIASLVVGGLLLVVSLATGAWIGAAAGAVLAVLGVLMMVNPILSVQAQEVRLRNPLGMTLRRFPVSSPADLRFEGNKLIHVPDDKKITSLGFGTNSADVASLRTQVEGSAG